MRTITDYVSMAHNKFWAEVDKKAVEAENTFLELWGEAHRRLLTQEEAVECLDALFIDSHRRIRDHSKELAKLYPTKQYTKGRLNKQSHLWWVDHFTAGINKWSTLSWFSKRRGYFRGSKKLRYAGASTHFVMGYHGYPFYIIPLVHGAWHEPKRNKDAISIEMVNAGALKLDRNTNQWHYWAREMPNELVRELPPVNLDVPYRGVSNMQPFTLDQIKANIVLKRIIIAALGERMAPERMSQHSDWKASKTDMGPLWQLEECNSAAFGSEPLDELSFIQKYQDFLFDEGSIWDEDAGWVDDEDDLKEAQENPEYGDNTPTHDDDDDDDHVMEIDDVQKELCRHGFRVVVDGKMGPKTYAAIKNFQIDWNKKHPEKKIKVDGIPGPMTCAALKE
jgi:N-acetyl-anhydromuramyl-L-alanine amidase AmpD